MLVISYYINESFFSNKFKATKISPGSYFIEAYIDPTVSGRYFSEFFNMWELRWYVQGREKSLFSYSKHLSLSTGN